MTFLDTNVLIYAFTRAGTRTDVAEGLLSSGATVGVNVLNEFCAVARRKLGMPWPDVAEALTAILTLCPQPVPITIETHMTALRLAQRYGYRIYDAIVLAAALQVGCEIVWTEDIQDGQLIDDSLVIRNPFRF